MKRMITYLAVFMLAFIAGLIMPENTQTVKVDPSFEVFTLPADAVTLDVTAALTAEMTEVATVSVAEIDALRHQIMNSLLFNLNAHYAQFRYQNDGALHSRGILSPADVVGKHEVKSYILLDRTTRMSMRSLS